MRRSLRGCLLTVVLIAPLVTSACGDKPTVFQPLTRGPLSVTTKDGVRIAATVTGHGRRAVILASMSAEDQTSWTPLLIAARDIPVTLITFDRRGVGASDGTADDSPFPDDHTGADVTAVYDLLRSHGYPAIGCIGASLGGTACYLIARRPGLAALGILASNPPSGASTHYLDGLRYPKLFVVAKGDRELVWPVEHMAAGAPGPKRLLELDTDRHGTNIFVTPQARRLLDALAALVREMSSSSP